MPFATQVEVAKAQAELARCKGPKEREALATELARRDFERGIGQSVSYFIKKYKTFSKATWKKKVRAFWELKKTPAKKGKLMDPTKSQ